ncbi:MAG: bifunctional phosphopantothenoylcysteine decarboxylase/phosphopantothenate--cysteine ligase CoaBC [Acidimicrobiia bacterium]
MSVLAGRHVVLGVAGGIAAYKSVELCRRLVDAGAHVAPIMTADAERFVGKVTLSALASEPVHTSLWDDAEPIPHTVLGQRADLVVVAPATARVIAAYAAGLSSDLLVATLVATRAPVLVCPAMHTEMWEHASTRDNLATLRRRGVHVLEPESGRLAGGDVGTGRLADPARIVAEIERILSPGDLDGLRVVVTAGGTREPIDAVRVVTNRSSGRQGHALADEAAARGAKVTLVTTAALPAPATADVVRVETAAQMLDAVRAAMRDADVLVMAAAVADARPESASQGKLKKDPTTGRIAGLDALRMVPTTDVLADAAATRRAGQVLVGFAAETPAGGPALEDLARAKLARKGVDLVVANDVSRPDAGFETETNEVVIVSGVGASRVSRRDKRAIAAAVWDSVAAIRRGADPHQIRHDLHGGAR